MGIDGLSSDGGEPTDDGLHGWLMIEVNNNSESKERESGNQMMNNGQ